jgi:hypothetical protein
MKTTGLCTVIFLILTSMTASTGSSVPDAAVLAAVLRSCRQWCWKQRLIACYVSKDKKAQEFQSQ